MRISVRVFILGLVLASLGTLSIYAQEKTDTTNTSLGDLARQLKTQKAKESKPAKVFTNDNLPTKPGEAEASSKPPENSPSPPAEGSGGGTQVHDEKYYRAQMSKLQSQLDTHKRELEVLQQKLGQNNMQFYSNPQDSMMQQYTRADINKLNADIAAKQKQIDDDQKAIDDLHTQLRQEGGDPAWLR